MRSGASLATWMTFEGTETSAGLSRALASLWAGRFVP